jgi:hypothetical protein
MAPANQRLQSADRYICRGVVRQERGIWLAKCGGRLAEARNDLALAETGLYLLRAALALSIYHYYGFYPLTILFFLPEIFQNYLLSRDRYYLESDAVANKRLYHRLTFQSIILSVNANQ